MGWAKRGEVVRMIRSRPGPLVFCRACIGIGGLFILTFLVGFEPAWARTWNVFVDGSGDATTIQAAIDSAASLDTVLAAPGIYLEALVFRGKDLVLRSVSGPETTFIDATGLGGRVVTFHSGETRSAVLQGFTITGGEGGILIFEAEPSLIGNIITENQTSGDGGGIWCSGDVQVPPVWHPLIKDNQITNNSAGNLGGGVGFFKDMIPEITENYIAGNKTQRGDGGGIYYRNLAQGKTLIWSNVVENNTAGDHGGGIYVGHYGDTSFLEIEIALNLIRNNYARGSAPLTANSGGGIWLWETNAWVHHNTIVENTGDGPSDNYGGGIVIERPGSPIVEQNIIALTQKGGAIWCGSLATPTIRNNLAWQNVGGEGVGTCATWWQADGNIVQDPHFCDAPGSIYSLAQNSPAITHPAGPLGAFSIPGCDPVAARPSTWGAIKARYSPRQ